MATNLKNPLVSCGYGEIFRTTGRNFRFCRGELENLLENGKCKVSTSVYRILTSSRVLK